MTHLKQKAKRLNRLNDELSEKRKSHKQERVSPPESVHHQKVFPLENPKRRGLLRRLFALFFQSGPDIRVEHHRIVSEADMVSAYDKLTGTIS